MYATLAGPLGLDSVWPDRARDAMPGGMGRVSLSVVGSLLIVACVGQDPTLGARGDGGSPSCTSQPESVRLQLCDATESNELLACDEGSAAPRPDCTKAVQANAYCCPIDPASTSKDAGNDAEAAGSTVNPDGVPYPTTHIGWTARTPTTRGDRIANLSFQGYRPNGPTLVTVSMADLYDPQSKKRDVVIIVGGGIWDTYTGGMLDAIHGSTKRIATLAVVGEGMKPGIPATRGDLSTWTGTYPWATTVLDAGFTKLAEAFNAAAIPLVMVIDTRTMEIDRSAVGAVTSTADIDALVDAVTNRPAAY
jgi:hypothetical protein